MKKKIIFSLCGIAFVVLSTLNASILSIGELTSTNLQKISLIVAASAEEQDGYESKVTTSGTVTQTRVTADGTETRTCDFTKVTCTGIGDVSCSPSFDPSNCTEWS